GLEQVAVETGGKEPTQKALADLVERARTEGARAVFVQAQFSTAAAETVAKAVGAAVVPIEDLAEDWLENLGRIAAALGAAR
ncbi:MAG TPA: zinc ABC transporter substrate-binding protein, partial [Spirochaetales bacterium]|nr:zinc ABC transporter substrate-binding protein [Spirochaetales bacterium]